MYYPPPLPPDEQIALCIRAKAGDRKARDRLVTTSMRFVVGRAHVFAKGHHRSGVEDLTSEGACGLLKAIERFDQERGVHFLTYASHWVDLHIRDAALRDREVKRGDSNRSNYLLAYRAHVKSGVSHEKALELVAQEKGAKVKTVKEVIAVLTMADALSLDADRNEEEGNSLHGLLPSHDEPADDVLERRQMAEHTQAVLDRVRADLDDRELAVLRDRILCDEDDVLTLAEVASPFGLSRERIRQLEAGVMAKLRDAFTRPEPVQTRPVVVAHAPAHTRPEPERVLVVHLEPEPPTLPTPIRPTTLTSETWPVVLDRWVPSWTDRKYDDYDDTPIVWGIESAHSLAVSILRVFIEADQIREQPRLRWPKWAIYWIWENDTRVRREHEFAKRHCIHCGRKLLGTRRLNPHSVMPTLCSKTCERKRSRELRLAETVAIGLCYDCKERPIRKGRVRCVECAIRYKGKDDARRAAFIKAGKCVHCGANPSVRGNKCDECRARHTATRRLRDGAAPRAFSGARPREERIQLGLCCQGACEDPAVAVRYCEKHRAERNARRKRERLQWRSAGVCTRCGKGKPDSGDRTCAACRKSDQGPSSAHSDAAE